MNSAMKKTSAWILQIFGWKAFSTVPEPPKSIICVAPHTSNWDFPIGKLGYVSLGREASFLIKKSWFFFPMGYVFSAMGGVAVDRSKRKSVTQQMVDEFNKHEKFHLAITPEGTRSMVSSWKMGFYHIAVGANVPIQLAYIDYKKRELGIKEVFYPTGNEEEDLRKIQDYYQNINAKFPKKFNLSAQSKQLD
jgi:1-acyl-sn-glycerol-3-phosphate acyltransferase